MAFKPYKPSPHSKGAEKAEERAWMARKPTTVKTVRDESRGSKAALVASKATTSPKYRGGPEGDGKSVASKATTSAPFSKGKGSPAAPVRSSTPAITNAPARGVMPTNKKSVTESLVDRVNQKPQKFTAKSEAMLSKTRGELDAALSVVGGASKFAARIGMGILKRGAAALSKKEAPKLLTGPRKQLKAPKPKLLAAPKPKPYPSKTSKYVPKKVKFPKAIKGRKITGTGTYTAN